MTFLLVIETWLLRSKPALTEGFSLVSAICLSCFRELSATAYITIFIITSTKNRGS